jgi:hypothetical protein
MFNLENTNRQALVSDLLKVLTSVVVAHMLKNYSKGMDMFDNEFVMGLVYTLIGFTAYHVVTRNVIKH